MEQGFLPAILTLLVTLSLLFLFYFNDFFLRPFQALLVLFQLLHPLDYLGAICILIRLLLNQSQ